MQELEKNLGYTFKNKELLKQALTHSSYANETRTQSNERLEFLGDSVLSLIVSDHIYNRFNTPEGELTKLRAALVCETSLYEFSKELNIGEFMLLGKGEQQYKGNERPSK